MYDTPRERKQKKEKKQVSGGNGQPSTINREEWLREKASQEEKRRFTTAEGLSKSIER